MGRNPYSLFKELNERFFDELMPKDFEIGNCIFCGPKPYYSIFEKGSIEIVRCSCGFVYSRNQPKQSALDAFYKKSKPMEVWSDIKTTDFKRQHEKFFRAIQILIKKEVKSVLDIGCGNGTFLNLLLKAKPEVVAHGIETNEKAVKIAREGGAYVVEQDIEGFLKFNQRNYDVISLWGVLEHLKDPIPYIMRLKQHLTKSGMLLVCVPNVQSRVVRSLWSEAYTFCHQHLWYFDTMSLSRALSLAGFRVLQEWTIEGEALPWLKKEWGFDPYKELPLWAQRRYIDNEMIEGYNKMFTSNNEGYKIVSIAVNI